jgi:hypothetical protein
MSFSFGHVAPTKEELKAKVAADPNVAEWKYCPAGVVDSINAAIDAMPGCVDDKGKAYHFRVSGVGHVSAEGTSARAT